MQWITLDGAVNIRDVGGLLTEDGQAVASKRLLRSDNLQGLSSADISLLVEEFGLTRVVDLRSLAEVTSEGPGPLTAVEAVEHVHHSVIGEDAMTVGDDGIIPDTNSNDATSQDVTSQDATSKARVAADVLLARRERFASENPDDIISGHYLGYLEDRPDSVIAALRAITETSGAVLVHCAAGKDRTGVVVALALLAVGVQREAVIADYVATGERIEAILARLRASDTYAAGIDLIPADAHAPRAGGMASFLGQIDREYGGVTQWLADQGFGPDEVERLRNKLLSESPDRPDQAG